MNRDRGYARNELVMVALDDVDFEAAIAVSH